MVGAGFFYRKTPVIKFSYDSCLAELTTPTLDYYHYLMKLIFKLLASTASVLIAAYIVPAVTVDSLKTALIVAVVMGAINVFIRPVLVLLTLPITVITLGIFAFLINVAIVMFVAYIVPGFDIATVFGALLFSLLLSLVNSFLSALAN